MADDSIPAPPDTRGFSWGSESSTETPRVVISWRVTASDAVSHDSVSVTEIVEATHQQTGTTAVAFVGERTDTQLRRVVDTAPPNGAVTYRVRTVVSGPAETDTSVGVTEREIELANAPHVSWPSEVSDTSTPVVSLELASSEVDATGVTASTTVTAEYENTQYTVGEFADPTQILVDTDAPRGNVSYTVTTSYINGRGAEQAVTDETAINTDVAQPPLLVDATLNSNA